MKTWLLAMAMALPGPAIACESLSTHYELCDEGTPWEAGDWVSGGDTDTLTVDGIDYMAFEDYYLHDPKLTIYEEMDLVTQRHAEFSKVKPLVSDRLAAADMAFVRVIEKVWYKSSGTEMTVTMIAEDIRDPQKAGARILISLRAPADTPLQDMDRLSREFAALVYPRTNISVE